MSTSTADDAENAVWNTLRGGISMPKMKLGNLKPHKSQKFNKGKKSRPMNEHTTKKKEIVRAGKKKKGGFSAVKNAH